MRLLKVAFMLIIVVDISIIIIALILLNPLIVLLFIAVSGILKGMHNQLIANQKLKKIYRTKSDRNPRLA